MTDESEGSEADDGNDMTNEIIQADADKGTTGAARVLEITLTWHKVESVCFGVVGELFLMQQ